MTDEKDKTMHYCQGTIVYGFVLDCEVEDHDNPEATWRKYQS